MGQARGRTVLWDSEGGEDPRCVGMIPVCVCQHRLLPSQGNLCWDEMPTQVLAGLVQPPAVVQGVPAIGRQALRLSMGPEAR